MENNKIDNGMDPNSCIRTMQSYLENSPLIILGSGASMPFGLPSMDDLAKSIRQNVIVKADPSYDSFCMALESEGLERAIDTVSLGLPAIQAIRETAWITVNECDQRYLEANYISPPSAIVQLLEKVIAPTPNKAVIVTTNYDRLPEYAADWIGASIVTGFEGEYIKKLESTNSSVISKRIRARERVVNIWKVHGCLDWFVDPKGKLISVPLSKKIPIGFSPLIVPPGKDKYSSTHTEPFRSIIAEADNAFTQAGAFISVGYGFNDDHLQPKLIAQISNNKPIVVLARTMTDACRHYIIDANVKKYLIFEKSDGNSTTVYGNGWTQVLDGQYWLLEEFLKIW